MSLPESGMLSPTTSITPLGNTVPTSITPETVEDFVPERINIVSPILEIANGALDITIKHQKLRLRAEITETLEQARVQAEKETEDPDKVEAIYGRGIELVDKLIGGVNPFDQLDLKALRDERVAIHTASHIGPRKVGIMHANAKAARIQRREDTYRQARTSGPGADGKWTLVRSLISESLLNLDDELAGGMFGEDARVTYAQDMIDSVWSNSTEAYAENPENGKKRYNEVIRLLSEDPEVIASMTVDARIKQLKDYRAKRSLENYQLGYQGILMRNPSAIGKAGEDLFQKMFDNRELELNHHVALQEKLKNSPPDTISQQAAMFDACTKLGKNWWDCMDPSAGDKQNLALVDSMFKASLDREAMSRQDNNLPKQNPFITGMDFIRRTGKVPTTMAHIALAAAQDAPGKELEETIAGINAIMAIRNERPVQFENLIVTKEQKDVVRMADQYFSILYGDKAFADNPAISGVDPQGLVTYNLQGVEAKMSPATAYAMAKEELANPGSPGAHDRNTRALLKASIGIDSDHLWTGELGGKWNQSLAMTLGVKHLKAAGIDVGSLSDQDVKNFTTEIMTEAVQLMSKFKMRPESAFREAGIQIAAAGWGNSSINKQYKDSGAFFQEIAEKARNVLGFGEKEVIQSAIDNPIFASWAKTTIKRQSDNKDIEVGNEGYSPHRAGMSIFMLENMLKTTVDPMERDALERTLYQLNNDHAFLAGGYLRVKAEDVEKYGFQRLDNGLTADHPYLESFSTGIQKSLFGAKNKRDVNIRFDTPDPDEELPDSSQYLLDPSKAQQWVAVQPDPALINNYPGHWTFESTPDYSTNERAMEVLANISRKNSGLAYSKSEGEWWTQAANTMGSGGGKEYNTHFEFHFGGDALVMNGGQHGGEMYRNTFPMSMDFGEGMQPQSVQLSDPGKYPRGYRYDPSNYDRQMNPLVKERIAVKESDFDTQEERDKFVVDRRLQEAQLKLNAVELHRASNTNALWSKVKDFPIVGAMTPQQIINVIVHGDASNTVDEYGNQF